MSQQENNNENLQNQTMFQVNYMKNLMKPNNDNR